jgi:hypothetical protein
MATLRTKFNVNTRRHGRLTIAILGAYKIAECRGCLKKSASDRDFFIKVLKAHLIEPALSEKQLSDFSDNVLTRIGRELIRKSLLYWQRYDAMKRERGDFFAKFRRLIEGSVKALEKANKRMQRDIRAAKKYVASMQPAFNARQVAELQHMLYEAEERRKLVEEAKHFQATVNVNERFRLALAAFQTSDLQRLTNEMPEKFRIMQENVQLQSMAKAVEGFQAYLQASFEPLQETVRRFNANFQKTIAESARDLNRQFEALYSSFSEQQINSLKDIATSKIFDSFFSTSVSTVNDIIRTPEVQSDLGKKAIDEIKTVTKKAAAKEKKLSGKKKIVLVSMMVGSIEKIQSIHNALEAGTLDVQTATVQILVLLMLLISFFVELREDK